jgi:hypothetical protein
LTVNFCAADTLKKEKICISELLSEKDIEKLMCRYPVRRTRVLGIIAQETGFNSKERYEDAVRKMLTDDNQSLNMVRDLVERATKILIDLSKDNNIHKE